MARSGRFGRQPRAATSLTNTIIAIAREFQNQRAQNVMDAWKSGGEFEGKKATDDLVLQFWRDKAAGVSPDDPLADTYKNTVTQLDYTIHESKMTADYAQHKKSDGDMVKFYLDWAKKVPKDSEFYRVLQRDAGQYMRNAKAMSETRQKQALELSYQTDQAATRKSYEAAGEYIIDTLRRVAQSGYADGGIAPAIAAPGSGSDLTDFDPKDPETMLRLLNVITPRDSRERDAGSFANTNVVYHDDNGKAITGADIMAQLQTLDPTFKPGQPLDIGYITGLLDRQNTGLQERIDRATKTGHMSDVNNLEKSKAYVATLNRQVAAWPIEKAYSELRSTFDSVANDPTASPAAVLRAHQEYVRGLNGLAADPNIAADDNLRSRLKAEANGQDGVPTLRESFTGLQNGAFDEASAKDSANTKAHMEFLQAQIDSVATGAAAWTFGTTGKDGTFVPDPTGREIGAAPVDQIAAYGAPGSMKAVTIPDERGGNPLTVYMTATPVYGTATDPVTGKPIHPENSNPVAYAYDIPSGGKVTTIFGFQSKDGMVFSEDPPWDSRLKVTASSSGGNHLEVDLSPLLPTVPGASPNSVGLGVNLHKAGAVDNLPGFHVQGVGNPTNGNPNPTGTLTFDPYAAVTSTSTRNALGSTDPNSDFHSLTLAALMSSPSGITTLRDLDKLPAFKAQIDADTYSYAGVQRDPATGAWVPGTGDQAKLAAAQGQTDMAKNSKSVLDFLGSAAKAWQRVQTGTPFAGGTSSSVPGANGQKTNPESITKLATDLVKGTPFEALGNAFFGGTSSLKPPPSEQAGGLDIKAVGTMKVPGVDGGLLGNIGKPISIQGPTAAPTQAQQMGSQAPTSNTGQTATQTGSQRPAYDGWRSQ